MFIYYISATLYIGTNRVPPTPYTARVASESESDSETGGPLTLPESLEEK